MKIKIINLYIVTFIFALSSTIFGQAVNSKTVSTNSIGYITGEDYVIGADGVPRITLNVWGHVQNPGTYLMYDGIDILTALSVAGGPLKGAKTKKIKIISKNGSFRFVDLDQLINDQNLLDITLNPHDTIYVDEGFGSYILSRGNVVNVLIQITNLILIATNNK